MAFRHHPDKTNHKLGLTELSNVYTRNHVSEWSQLSFETNTESFFFPLKLTKILHLNPTADFAQVKSLKSLLLVMLEKNQFLKFLKLILSASS